MMLQLVKLLKKDKNVTYVYQLKQPKGNVYVHYVDVNGNKIKDDVTDEKDQPVDKDYDTVVDNRPSTIEFQGKTYELVPAGNYPVGQVDEQGHWTGDDATTGKVVEGDKNVTYVYKLKEDPTKPKEGDVIITYVDEKGKENSKNLVKTHQTHHMIHHITQLRKVKNLTLSRLQTVRHTRSYRKVTTQ